MQTQRVDTFFPALIALICLAWLPIAGWKNRAIHAVERGRLLFAKGAPVGQPQQ